MILELAAQPAQPVRFQIPANLRPAPDLPAGKQLFSGTQNIKFKRIAGTAGGTERSKIFSDGCKCHRNSDTLSVP